MLTKEKAESIADRINAAGVEDTFGCKIVASVWESPRGCRVYVKTTSRAQRQLGYFDASGYVGKSRKALRQFEEAK